jgi:hypothetical protein
MTPDVVVEWRRADDEDYREKRCLYALVDARRKKIGYIGKAYKSNLAARLRCKSKAPVLRHLRNEGMEIAVLFGEIILPPGERVSEEQASDIESLLIAAETPIANIQCCGSRGISRPGLLVACYGCWPGKGRFYADC